MTERSIAELLSSYSKEELSLLTFFETCCVDHSGLVDARRMNDDDHKIAERWHESGFVLFGRVMFADIKNHYANWCELSPMAWEIAQAARVEKARRMFKNRTWHKSVEKNEE